MQGCTHKHVNCVADLIWHEPPLKQGFGSQTHLERKTQNASPRAGRRDGDQRNKNKGHLLTFRRSNNQSSRLKMVIGASALYSPYVMNREQSGQEMNTYTRATKWEQQKL